jgi:threonine/homoserine/homoserine lactone efflux protein
MNWSTWWIFVCMETVLCLTPGPAVLFVLSSALKSGARKSIASNLGILAANLVYFALSATGIGALLLSSKLFLAVKWVGAAYLVVIGLRLLIGHKSVVSEPLEALNDHKSHHLFFDGFTVQISNPKAILFFSALLPQFLNPHAAVVPQIVILGATSGLIEFSILLGYGMAGASLSPRYARWTNRVAGGLLIGAGAGIATR